MGLIISAAIARDTMQSGTNDTHARKCDPERTVFIAKLRDAMQLAYIGHLTWRTATGSRSSAKYLIKPMAPPNGAPQRACSLPSRKQPGQDITAGQGKAMIRPVMSPSCAPRTLRRMLLRTTVPPGPENGTTAPSIVKSILAISPLLYRICSCSLITQGQPCRRRAPHDQMHNGKKPSGRTG